MNEDLARRSIDSAKWNFVSNILYNAIYFVQTIILARLLPVEAFGVYAGAAAIVVMTNAFSTFGMASAFIHRCKETEDLEKTAAIHFTLQLLLSLLWMSGILALGLTFLRHTEPGYLTVLLVLAGLTVVKNLASTPHLILVRKIQFQRYASITVIDAIVTFILALSLALLRQPIWALLATSLSSTAVQIIVYYFWRPVWKPRLAWDAQIVRYFFSYGGRYLVSGILLDVLDRGDDFWSKTYLGSEALGYYSRAYAIAKVPANIIAAPVAGVAASTYASLKNDRPGLSQAFFETNSLLIRLGFLFVGVLGLVSPEFIRIILGEKWMPMLLTFQIMLPFTMFDPVKQMMASLFAAVGKPQINVQIRGIQVAIMVSLLYLLGSLYGIEGVAIAVDCMMVAGIVLMLIRARQFVDIDIRKLYLNPLIGIALGLAAGYLASLLFPAGASDWVTGAVKTLVFSGVFGLVLWITERERLFQLLRLVNKYIFRNSLNLKPLKAR